MIAKRLICWTAAAAFGFWMFAAEAVAEEQVLLADVKLDRTVPNAKRGAEITVTTCLACHSIKHLKYRHLRNLGFTQDEMDRLRADKPIEASLVSNLGPEQLAAAFGITPPDLSLITAARPQGGRYLYSLLTGYYKTPAGNMDNHLFPGVRMPDVLGYANTSVPAERTELEAQAEAVAVFLEWAADPHAGERTRLGYFVMAYLIFLTTLLYLIKRRVWHRIEQTPPVKE
jgi:ubiquinol-cytochrome c reductase cytochrome c1 subunit